MRWIRLLWMVGAVLAVALTQSAVAERDIFRCTHPDGRIEFRGAPVTGAECTHIGYRQGGSDETGAASDPMAEEPQPVGTESTEPVDPWVHNCRVARENLEMLESGLPVVIKGPGGEPALLSESDRAARMTQARRDVDYWCADSAGVR